MKKLYLFILISLLISNNCDAQVSAMSQDSLYQTAASLIKKHSQEEALEIALKEIDNKNNNIYKSQWLVLIGDIFNDKEEYRKAYQYYRKAYKINTSINDSLALMQDHIKLGVYFQQKFNKNYNNRGNKKNLLLKDSAVYYYNKNLTNFSSVPKGLTYKKQSHNNLSYLFSDIDSLDTALLHIIKAIEYSKKLKDTAGLNSGRLNKGLIYIYQEKYLEAKKINLSIINSKIDTTNIERLITKRSATGNLSYIYTKTNKHKEAYSTLLKYNELSGQIEDKQKAVEITIIEAKYNQDKARAEEALKTEKERKEKEKTQYILAGTGITSLLVMLFGTVLYRNSKLKAKNLSLNLVEQELNQQKTLRVLQEKNQSKLLNATLDGRETERKEIAQTLHDSVSALLSSANMHLQVVKKKATNSIEELDKSQRIIDEASGKVRDLSHKLISAVLLKFGLEHAVYDMCEKYSNQDLEFELESEDKIPRFNQDFEIKIHNIIEECINNIMKHSKASEASVFLLLKNNILHATITDNGVGFDASKITPTSGIGLSQIKARIENMEGVFDIESKINNGTKIIIEVPVEEVL